MYAKVSNNQIVQYPANPRTDNPSVSFPSNWQGGQIGGSEYVVVMPSSHSAANLGWTITESTPVNVDGVWQQNWATSLKTKDGIKSDVTDKRYKVEVGGVVIANNTYATDRESQTKYVAVAVDIQQSNTQSWSITWKTQNNQFVNLNAQEMSNVITGVRQHVQNSFNKEAEYYQLIDTANNAVLEATDFSAGWPSNT